MYKRILHEGKACYGKHALFHLSGCNERILSIEAVKAFIAELVEAIDMVAYGECHCYRFGEGEELGLSGVQLIYTSSITIHTNDLHREAYLDVFSCKDFAEGQVVACIRQVFSPETVDCQSIIRE